MKPIILMTVYRRYHELVKNLKLLRQFNCFQEQPEVVIVWAQPEDSRLFLFEELLKQGIINHVLGRPVIVGENDTKATTYAESHSLRLGLEFIKDTYGDGHYVIVQTADIAPTEKTYRTIDKHFHDGKKAVLFYWDNSVCKSNIWHTNFCGLCLETDYWMPVSSIHHEDVLERQWGVILSEKKLDGIVRWHNYEQKQFVHAHESEQLPDFEKRGTLAALEIPCLISGRNPFYLRLWKRVKHLFGVIFRKG